MRRPDVFTLDYSHPLAQGLVFAGMCGEHDSTLYRNDIAAEGGPAFRYDPTIGRCVWDFDGTDDRLVIPSAPHLQFGAGGAYPFTVCAWVYMRSSKAFRIFSKFDGAAENYEWSLHTINTSTLHFRCYTDVDNYIGRSTGTVLSLVGSWAHIVGLYRGGLSISNIEIYINGIRSDNINSSSSGYTGIGSTDQPLYIGYRDATVSWSNGLQADTLAFNRALSPAEIALLADRTDPMLGGLIVEERPVLWFPLSTGGTPYAIYQDMYAAISWDQTTLQDAVSKISTLHDLTQDAASAISSAVDAVQDATSAISSTVATTQDAQASISLVYSLSHDAFTAVSEDYLVLQDAQATISEQVGYVVHQDALAQIHETYAKVQDASVWISSEIIVVQDARAVISEGVVYSVTQDAIAQISTVLLVRQDAVSKIATTVQEIQDAVAGVSSGYLVIQDGKAVIIEVDYSTMAKIVLPSQGVTHLSLPSSGELRIALTSKNLVTVVKLGG